MQVKELAGATEQSRNAHIRETRTYQMHDVLSRCLPSFYRTAYRHVGNAADAEDVVQEALLSAYRHLDQFQGQAQMSSWLRAIVTNCARMKLRRRPRQIHLSLDERFGAEQEYSLLELLPACQPSPEEACRGSELHRHVVDLVAQLSPPLRRAFQLRELDGLSTRETAEVLGVTDGTVKAQLARARAKLSRMARRVLDIQPRSVGLAVPARKTRRRRVSANLAETGYNSTIGDLVETAGFMSASAGQ
jgi:RNA polymerase sigma-70 factor, ECF subfamily